MNPSDSTLVKPIDFYGRICLGAAVAATGLMQVVNGEMARIIPALPAWVPLPAVGATLVGLILLFIGGAILARYRVREAVLGLAGLLAASFVFQRIPELVANPGQGFVWTNPAKVLALMGGVLTLGALAEARPLTGLAKFAGAAPLLLAVFLVICGVQHFFYAGFVDSLVPSWIPPAPRFWTYFSGAALVAGGLGLLLPSTRRLAALLSGLMIFLWLLLLHIPRSLELKNASELAGCFEALALAGTAWLMAANAVMVTPSPESAGKPLVVAE
jgi:uncharacterized membrane protein